MDSHNTKTKNNTLNNDTTSTSTNQNTQGNIEPVTSWSSEKLIKDALAQPSEKKGTPTGSSKRKTDVDEIGKTNITSTPVETKKKKTGAKGKIPCYYN